MEWKDELHELEMVVTFEASLSGAWISSLERVELRDGSSLLVYVSDPELEEAAALVARVGPACDLEARRAIVEELLASQGSTFHAARSVPDLRWCSVVVADPILLDAARAGYRRAVALRSPDRLDTGPQELEGADEATLDEFTSRWVTAASAGRSPAQCGS